MFLGFLIAVATLEPIQTPPQIRSWRVLDIDNPRGQPDLLQTEYALAKKALAATPACNKAKLRYAFTRYSKNEHEHFVVYVDGTGSQELVFGTTNTFYDPRDNTVRGAPGAETWKDASGCY